MSELTPSLLEDYATASRWVIAFSGGVDSTALLHLAERYCREKPSPPKLVALHIHHGLSPNADNWLRHCEKTCDHLSIPLHAERVDIGESSGHGLEAQAREARYAVFESFLAEGDLLLAGHHRDDQAETFLLRALRGSGPRGLASIPRQRGVGKGQLARPLLKVSRQQIESYANDHGLSWVDDESNQQSLQDRNFLRNRVLPLLQERWPMAAESLALSAEFSGEAAQLLEELAETDLSKVASGRANGGYFLTLEGLGQLSAPRQQNLLRFWLERSGMEPPSQRFYQQLFRSVIEAGDDARPELLHGRHMVSRFQGAIYLLDSAFQGAFPVDGDLAPLDLPGMGQVSVEQGRPGLRSDREYRWGSKVNGLKVQLQGNSVRKPLKRLYQERGVPFWWRRNLPLVYCGETLAAIPGVGVCEGFFAEDGQAILLQDCENNPLIW